MLKQIQTFFQLRSLPSHHRDYYFRTINMTNGLLTLACGDLSNAEAKNIWKRMNNVQAALKAAMELNINSQDLYRKACELQRKKSALRLKHNF
jgi:hypothetical protein